ncbi:MAG: tRNA dihydrouridine synthase DusB [Candidatus Deferrimicrobiota bacterium]
MDFRGKLILAPLAGITDTTFRLLCRENGADIVLTEMASAKGLLMQPERTRRFLEFREGERPVGAQLFGASPGEIGEAAGRIRDFGFDFVDINMGCPVRKVTAGGSGAAILSNPMLAGELVAAAVRGGCGIPVTVKIRSGFGKESETYLEVARAVFGAGAAAVTLHPRTRGQMFSGFADWGQIAALKREFPDRVIVGNGDVRLPEDASRMIAATGCDAVMIGRAALGNPWIFRSHSPSSEERKALILRHGEEMHLRLGDAGIREMRKHLAWYSRGIPGAAAFRGELVRVGTLDDYRAAVGRFF